MATIARMTLTRVTLARRAARTPLAPVVGIMFGLVAAILVAAVPVAMLDQATTSSGLPGLLSFAAPPLGMKARALAVTLAFVIVGVVLWQLLAQIDKFTNKARKARAPWHDEIHADPAAPALIEGRRRPIFAPAELGAPLMSDEAIAPPPVPELEAPLSATEFDLPATDTPETDDSSIQSLIRRLETGLARRATNDVALTLSADWIVPTNAAADVPYIPGTFRRLASF